MTTLVPEPFTPVIQQFIDWYKTNHTGDHMGSRGPGAKGDRLYFRSCFYAARLEPALKALIAKYNVDARVETYNYGQNVSSFTGIYGDLDALHVAFIKEKIQSGRFFDSHENRELDSWPERLTHAQACYMELLLYAKSSDDGLFACIEMEPLAASLLSGILRNTVARQTGIVLNADNVICDDEYGAGSLRIKIDTFTQLADYFGYMHSIPALDAKHRIGTVVASHPQIVQTDNCGTSPKHGR